MLRWDEVRRLIVRHLAPSVTSLGFSPPGRTMRRGRGPFVDVIDFRCGKWGDRFQLAFGCGLRALVRQNPKPSGCAFYRPHFVEWPAEYFTFQGSVDEQVEGLIALRPLFLTEVERWFALLSDVEAARRAAEVNDSSSNLSVGIFGVPSPSYYEVLRQLDSVSDVG